MRILVLNYEFPPLGGGAAKATYFMAQELSRRGHSVTVMTAGQPGAPATETIGRVKVCRVRSWRKGVHDAGMLGAITYLLFGLVKLRRLIKDNDFDCAHFFFALPTGALAFYWRWRTGKPYVVSLRGSDVPGYNDSIRVLHKLLVPITGSILRGAHRVVANSGSLRDLALESFPTASIDVITNGVCRKAFRPALIEVPKRTSVRVLCVARLINRKGIETLLNATAMLADRSVYLDIVGTGPLLPQLKELARAHGIEDLVSFYGPLQGDALRRRYQEADIFALPSTSESFSMALLEAMASGLPIIASNIGGNPELVKDGVNGFLVDPDDAWQLSQAIRHLSASAVLRMAISHRNRQTVAQKYSWAGITDQYLRSCFQTAITDLGERGRVAAHEYS